MFAKLAADVSKKRMLLIRQLPNRRLIYLLLLVLACLMFILLTFLLELNRDCVSISVNPFATGLADQKTGDRWVASERLTSDPSAKRSFLASAIN